MNIFNSFDHQLPIPNAVLTIGTFDGVHVGHQKIIQKLNDEAKIVGGESVLFTFYPHPRMVLFPDSHGLKLIQTQDEKLDKLKRFGLQNVIVQPFTSDFSNLSALEFVRDYLVGKLKVKKLVIGYDHQFGKNREGSLDFLKEISKQYNFEVIEIPAQEIDEVNISSTRIRKSIELGNIERVNQSLGEPFELNGIVVSGNQIGRTIGFPTANVKLEDSVKIVPGNGVYAVEVLINSHSTYKGMMNIGVKPTIDSNLEKSIEVNIFDFNQDIYGKHITIRLISRIRDEFKFSSIEELTNKLKQDEINCRTFFHITNN
jgi:riboflavin kinase/FMN adenylyltransferase